MTESPLRIITILRNPSVEQTQHYFFFLHQLLTGNYPKRPKLQTRGRDVNAILVGYMGFWATSSHNFLMLSGSAETRSHILLPLYDGWLLHIPTLMTQQFQ